MSFEKLRELVVVACDREIMDLCAHPGPPGRSVDSIWRRQAPSKASQIVQLQGDSNILNLVQSGSEYQTLELTHYGNDTTFTIIQSDGNYTAGLEGLGTISNFDGSYTQPVPTPDFAQGPFIEVGP